MDRRLKAGDAVAHRRDRPAPVALAEGVEGWGWRWSQEHGELIDRRELARRWYEEEYVPVVTLLRDAGLLEGAATETDAYMNAAAERYKRQRGL